MKITKIEIENYKSIEKLAFNTSDQINIFIGENSVGKSNIFDAITWLLGPVYPSFNSTQPQDRFNGKDENEIKIRLTIDDGNYLELAETWTDPYSRPKTGLNLSGNYINDIDRQRYCSAYVGVDRAIMDYLPSNRWSLLGRILREINELFKQEEVVDEETGEVISKPEYFKRELETLRDDILFSVKDRHGNDIMKKFVEILQVESAKQLNREETEFSVDLNLYDPWNFYRTLQLIVHESDTALSFQASNLGMGVQASISIAVLKAYAQLKLNNNTPLFIDEPELFLHPHAQLNFNNVLRELAESGTQIFITTHSPIFLSVGHFNEICLVRKTGEHGTYIRQGIPQKFVQDLKIRKNIDTNPDDLMEHYRSIYDFTGDTRKANEAFFAKKIILVEGQSEGLILPYFFELANFDFIGKGISIVRCGDKGQIDAFYRLYSEFGIPCYIIFDGDKQNQGTEDVANTINKNHDLIGIFDEVVDFPSTGVKDNYLVFETTLEDNLGFVVGRDVKGLKLYRKVKDEINTKEQLPDWVEQIIGKIEALPETAISILKTEENNG